MSTSNPTPAPTRKKTPKLPWAVAGVMTVVALASQGGHDAKASPAATATVTSTATTTTTVTASPSTVTVSATRTVTAATKSTTTQQALAASPTRATTTEPSDADTSGQSDAAGDATYFKNCAAARAAGAAPLHRGDPGYRSGLDRDGDGVACETH